MLSTLEGVLIALMVAFSPADRAPDGGPMAAAMPAVDPAAACERYSSDTARRNCVARIGRPLETADAALFPEQVSWVAPVDPGMPDPVMLRRPR
jgi:hypothetical protein